MSKKEPTGYFVPSSGFLNDGIKKWKLKETQSKRVYEDCRNWDVEWCPDIPEKCNIRCSSYEPKEPTREEYNIKTGGNMEYTTPWENGYLAGEYSQKKKLIKKFLEDLGYIDRSYKDHELFKIALIKEIREKWVQKLDEYT